MYQTPELPGIRLFGGACRESADGVVSLPFTASLCLVLSHCIQEPQKTAIACCVLFRLIRFEPKHGSNFKVRTKSYDESFRIAAKQK